MGRKAAERDRSRRKGRGKKHIVKMGRAGGKSTTAAAAALAKRQPKGLPPVHVPDLSTKVIPDTYEATMTAQERKLRGLMTLDQVSLTANHEAMECSAEERAMLLARAFCQGLLKENEEARQLAGCLIATRRMYAVFYRRLQELLDTRAGCPPLAEDYFVQSLMHQAAQPFNEQDLMQGFVDTVLPYIATVVDVHLTADARAEREAREAAEVARQGKPVPLGFRVDPESASPDLSRQRSLVLAGPADAVAFVLEQIVTHALAGGMQVVRFLEQPPQGRDQHARLARVAPNWWRGCANSPRGLALVMGEQVQDKQAQLVDLLVCDNLALAHTAGYVGRPPAASAGDAHKVLRKWCDRGGAALLGAVPLASDDDPDLRTPEFEQLRTFTDLRGVTVRHQADDLAEGHVRIRVGASLHHWDVPREVWQSFNKPVLITPA